MKKESRLSGLSRRELWVDARDLQSADEAGEALSPEEYKAALSTRGRERLAECPVAQSFSAVGRTTGAAFAYGKDFFLGDTITVRDERLGVTVDAVVAAAQHGVTGQGETLELTLGFPQPGIFERLSRKVDK